MRAAGKLADPSVAQTSAIKLLGDVDPTVREAAANVLTPVPSNDALLALAAQLNEPYAPLHEALRNALLQPADTTVRQATIALAAKSLDDPNPRRREDASFVLGALKSDAALERHIALLEWTPNDPLQSDWPLVAQAAESMGRIGDAKAVDRLMSLVKAAPDASEPLPKAQHIAMLRAMASAMTSLGQLHHAPALAEAVRIMALDPQKCPSQVRVSSAFAIGMLDRPDGRAKFASQLLKTYGDIYESQDAKFEALKALGNLRHTPAAEPLKSISESDGTAELRWISHWSYQRVTNTNVTYHPPTRLREAPVSITDLPPERAANEKQGN
jgi:HEAT repeat protein